MNPKLFHSKLQTSNPEPYNPQGMQCLVHAPIGLQEGSRPHCSAFEMIFALFRVRDLGFRDLRFGDLRFRDLGFRDLGFRV